MADTATPVVSDMADSATPAADIATLAVSAMTMTYAATPAVSPTADMASPTRDTATLLHWWLPQWQW